MFKVRKNNNSVNLHFCGQMSHKKRSITTFKNMKNIHITFINALINTCKSFLLNLNQMYLFYL